MVGREIVTRVRERGEQDLTANKEMLGGDQSDLGTLFS